MKHTVQRLRTRFINIMVQNTLVCFAFGLLSQARGWKPALFALSVTGYLVVCTVAYWFYRIDLKTLRERFTE